MGYVPTETGQSVLQDIAGRSGVQPVETTKVLLAKSVPPSMPPSPGV